MADEIDGATEPSRTTTGACVAGEKPGCVVPSIVSVSEIVGRELASMMTCGAAPGRPNSIRSAPGLALAVVMAARRVFGPESAADVTTIGAFALAAGGART